MNVAVMPYIGAKISLISKSEIRYEGTLYTIDTNESTIALAKVRSFGTENRPTDRPVAPRDEVYEYIIFRGSDIKDIRFVEPPKPQPTLQGGLPNDPAILQHSAPDGPGAPGSGRHPSGGSQPGGTGPPGQQQGGQAPQVGFGPIGSSSSLGGPGPNSTASSGFSAPGGAPFSAAPGAPVSGGPGGASSGSPVLDILRDQPGSPGHGHEGGGQQSQQHQQQHPPQAAGFVATAGGHRGGGRGGGGDHHRGGGWGGGGGGQHHQQGGPVQFQRNGGGGQGLGPRGGGGMGGRGRGNFRGGFRGRGGGMGGGRPDHDGRGGSGFVPGRPTSNKKEPLKFDSEYDFEHANEEFAGLLQKLKKTSIDGGEGGDNNKDETEKAEGGSDAGGAAQPEDGEIVEKEGVGEGQEGGDEDEGPPEVFYDKKKSFFDSISCEATERSKGRTQRPDWRAEKKLNKETFGTTGGGGGGYGWRGGYRGGGGFRGGYRGGRGGGGGGYYNNYRGGGGGFNNGYGGRFSRDQRGRGGQRGQDVMGGGGGGGNRNF